MNVDNGEFIALNCLFFFDFSITNTKYYLFFFVCLLLEFSKDHICLYDDSQPIIPFSSLKTEYNKKFGRIYSPRSRSVPNKFDLNATTNELLEALRYDFNDIASNRLSRYGWHSIA